MSNLVELFQLTVTLSFFSQNSLIENLNYISFDFKVHKKYNQLEFSSCIELMHAIYLTKLVNSTIIHNQPSDVSTVDYFVQP